MATYTLLTQMNTPGGAVSKQISASAGSEIILDGETVPIATDTLMNVAFPFATVKAYFLVATVDCTIETNATDASGGQTINLTANVPLAWITGGAGSNVWSANVTKFYVTSAATGTLTLRLLYDPTP